MRVSSWTTRAGLVVLAVAVALPITYVVIERQRMERRLVHLLCETDHRVLLDACRELSHHVIAADLTSMRYVLRSHPAHAFLGRRRPSNPDVSHIGEAILDIDPLTVEVREDGTVRIQLHWAPSYGVIAYPEDRKPYRSAPGDRELTPGLWFFDEDYSLDRNPRHTAYIDTLVTRGSRRGKVKSGTEE